MANQQSAGAGFVPKPSGGLYLSTMQEDVPNATFTDVELDAIDPDYSDGIENITTHKITPGVAGHYLIIAQVRFTNLVIDKHYQVYVVKNDSVYIIQRYGEAVNDTILDVGFSRVRYLEAADNIKLVAKHDAGVGTVDISAGREKTFFSVQRVR